MSKIELKVIYDDEENPIINFLNFNNQLIEFFKGLHEHKKNQDIFDFEPNKPVKLMFHIGGIAILSKIIKWYSVFGLAFSAGNPSIIVELDELLEDFGNRVIKQVEEKENNTN